MKKLMLTTVAATALGTAAFADGHSEIKVGIILGYTGAIESMVAEMGPAAELAVAEVNESGLFLGGTTVTALTGDTTCTDSSAAVAATERLVTSDGVVGIVGGDCSGVTGAMLQNVARPNGIVMVSPSATSPALSTAEDDGLFFRTAPSDARQGQVMAEILTDKGIDSVAVTYTNNDYGKGLADAFQASFAELGGSVTLSAAHEDGKADYSSEVAALSAAGGDVLVVAGYVDQGGSGVIRAALDTGAFDTFQVGDGMISDVLISNFGSDIDGSGGQHPAPSTELAEAFAETVSAAGASFSPSAPFAPESYDAAALLLLAMQAAESSDPAAYKDKVFDVANAPGEQISAGDLARGLEILASGGEIDYVGASGVELIGPGEAAGTYREMKIENGEDVTVGFR